jgi:hypothetical protein
VIIIIITLAAEAAVILVPNPSPSLANNVFAKVTNYKLSSGVI